MASSSQPPHVKQTIEGLYCYQGRPAGRQKRSAYPRARAARSGDRRGRRGAGSCPPERDGGRSAPCPRRYGSRWGVFAPRRHVCGLCRERVEIAADTDHALMAARRSTVSTALQGWQARRSGAAALHLSGSACPASDRQPPCAAARSLSGVPSAGEADAAHAAILLAPSIIGQLGNADLAHRIRHRHPLAAQRFNLPQLHHGLVGSVSLLSHCGPPSWSKPYFKVESFNGGITWAVLKNFSFADIINMLNKISKSRYVNRNS